MLAEASGDAALRELDPEEPGLTPDVPLDETEALEEPAAEPSLDPVAEPVAAPDEEVVEALAELVAAFELAAPPGEDPPDGVESVPRELDPHAAPITATAAATETMLT